MSDEKSLQRRTFLKATGGAATALTLAGCSTTDDPGTTDGGTDDTNGTDDTKNTDDGDSSGGNTDATFQLTNATMSTLDPIKATDTASGEVIQQVFDPLMNYPNAEVAVEPLLATDFEVSADSRTYTFTLKEGATFHNGDTVTAQDFVYSFERLAASEHTRRDYFILDSMGVKHETKTVTTDDGEETEVYKPGSLAVRAVDDTTLEIELAQPFHSTLEMLAYTAFAAVPEGILGDVKGYDGEMSHKKFATQNPIGAGPFSFETWETNTQAAVTRFDDYHGQTASVARVHWQVITDTDALYNYGQNKNADLAPMPTSKYDPTKVTVEETDDLGRQVGTYGPMRNGETANYLSVPTINTYYIGLNAKNVEEPARKAIAYAMNQQEGVDQVFKGRGKPAYHFTPPSIYPGGASAYDQHAKENYPYGYNTTDLESARQVMKDAGYGPNNKYEVTFTTYQSDTWQGLGKILRDKLSSAHITMKLEEAPFSTLLNRGRSGNLAAFSLGWAMDWPAPDNFWGQLAPPKITDTSDGAAGAYVDWDDAAGSASQRAADAWETISNNQAPTDAAQQKRNDGYVTLEEANWEDMVLLPAYHAVDERFAYDWVDIPKFGGGGDSRQKYNTVSIGSRR
ncbi:ABC transporter substrate-binding protein [Haloarchaeobius sp. HME9146]|uniref:ABC transporter substrate-binding protein n=1 Tax=Haloarchaeobius sp. HME9146 TaxID=2978732 RepID=UPI0021C09170|nr:ABC transporter substrate-binding protein [Haloarchaeobius sp. HME9146]MCT9095325.1 ABC transporter substrate-binding protein [Haloarchaeobius sp. HME9146]